MAGFHVGGLASSLPTDDIIRELMAVERRPIDRLNTRKAEIAARQAAVQEMNTRLQALRDKAAALSTGNLFGGMKASSSETSVLTASGGAGAAGGVYQVTVTQLAQAHQVKSQGFADTDSTRVGTGTLTIQVGSGSTTTLTLDNTNNTLAGLRDAINAAKAGVSASIIDDGSGTGKRLILSSGTTGQEGAITLSADLAGGTTPVFTDLQAAQNAEVTLGSGAGALTISKSSNTLTDVIPGATLSLQKVSSSPVTVTVQADVEGVVTGVREFVEQYNQFHEFVASQTKYDPTSKQGGILLGDFETQTISSDVINQITGVVSGLPAGMNSLTDLGVSLNGQGVLQLDETTLRAKLASDPTGVTRIFAAQGTAANTDLTFVSATTRTKPGIYAVEVTQAASQARVTAGAAQTGVLAQAETLMINGTAIALSAGMDQAAVIDAINAVSSKTGVVASATGADGTGAGGYLTLTQKGYGSVPTITAVSSVSSRGAVSSGIGTTQVTPSAAVGESGGTGAAGMDVAGTLNGEAATGNGQFLVGKSGNATTDGLQVRVTGSATGSLGTLQVTLGVGHSVKTLLNTITDPVSGKLKTLLNSFEAQTKEITDAISTKEAALVDKELQLRMKFARLEGTIGRLQSQSERLSAQIAQFQQQKSK